MDWLISANPKLYKHEEAFDDFGFIDWRMRNRKYAVGDTVYIYLGHNIRKVLYKCNISRINLDSKEYKDDFDYWIDKAQYAEDLGGQYMRLELIERVDNKALNLENLKNNGLKNAPQGAKKLNGKLLNYISFYFNANNSDNFYPDEIEDNQRIYEGSKKIITVNSYERNAEARQKCIELYGLNCQICGIDFEQRYGEIGKGFIHVHHKIPLYTISKTYAVDYKTDLIPVCPNCHAMLHRKLNGKELTVDELKKKITT